MKQDFNGKECDADDWAEIFKKADHRFKLLRIKSPPKSMLSIIKVEWSGPTCFEA